MLQRLFDFLSASPVNFLATAAVCSRLDEAGYRRLDATAPLGVLLPGDKVYVTKNDSSVYAFHIGRRPVAEGDGCARVRVLVDDHRDDQARDARDEVERIEIKHRFCY